MGMTAPDPAQMGPAAADPGAPPGQSAQLLQQVQDLLAQVMQSESDPDVQNAVGSILQVLEPLMQKVGGNDAQQMQSGLNTPGGPPPDMGAPAPDMSAMGGGGPPPPATTFSGAKKQAMDKFKSKGHFSGSTSKGEKPQTNKTKNRTKGR